MTTHWVVDSGAPSSPLNVSRATFTMVVSSNTMIRPEITTSPVTITWRSSLSEVSAVADEDAAPESSIGGITTLIPNDIRLTFIEHKFDDYGMVAAKRQRAAAALASVTSTPPDVVPEDTGLPVLPALEGLLPGLRRGQVVELDGAGALPLALMAGASQAGSWCGIVGMPEFGMVAAAEIGCDLDRLLLVDEPGSRWADVTAALLEAVDIVLLQPPARPQTGLVRRLVALARKSGSVLLVAGGWEGSALRMRIDSSLWTGAEQGHGHLRSRRVKVVAEGRGTGGQPCSAWLWLPGPDGSVSRAELAVVSDPAEVA